MNKKIFWIVIPFIVVAILYYFISGFFKMSPHITTIFEKGVQLEQQQELTDSVIRFSTTSKEIVEVNLNENQQFIFHFWSSENKTSLEEIDILNSKKQKNFFVLTKDSISHIERIKKENNIQFEIYHYNPNELPFTHKNIDIFPYTIIIKNDSIQDAYLGKIK